MDNRYFKEDFEILISTMNRNSLDFLIPMFPFSHFSEFQIIIINQTSKENVLVSNHPSLKVVNSFDIGISKSRNAAISNSKRKIILFTDDDVVFIENFDEIIIQAYNSNPSAGAICFQTITTQGKPFSKYPKHNKILNNNEIRKVLSIELSCNWDVIKKEKITFNEWFGLGSQFQDSETFFFLRNMKHKAHSVLFCAKNIVIHKSVSSSDDADSDRIIYAKMAGFYKIYGIFGYLYLLKYVFFLRRKYGFSINKLCQKFWVGLSGIRAYKSILNNKWDSSYE